MRVVIEDPRFLAAFQAWSKYDMKAEIAAINIINAPDSQRATYARLWQAENNHARTALVDLLDLLDVSIQTPAPHQRYIKE